MVDVSADTAGNQRQNERRFRKLELGVIFTDLCRFRTEKSAVESDGPVKVACIERNVKFDKRSVNSCHMASAYYHLMASIEAGASTGAGIEGKRTRNAAMPNRATAGASARRTGI